MRLIRCLFLIGFCLWPVLGTAADDISLLEKVARSSAAGQSGLQSYQVTVETAKIQQMLTQMTANLPADAPRPPTPKVRKYWHRARGESLIRAEGGNVFPMMQEMVQRFSGEFAIDLRSFLLPRAQAEKRGQLISKASVKQSDNQVANRRIVSFTLKFSEPTAIGKAFYGAGIDLPRERVERLVFDVDPERLMVNRIEISVAGNVPITMEIRYRELAGGFVPEVIRVTSPDGNLDDRFQTEFVEVEGYWLPERQLRETRHGDQEKVMEVIFRNYQVNAAMPDDVLRLLTQ